MHQQNNTLKVLFSIHTYIFFYVYYIYIYFIFILYIKKNIYIIPAINAIKYMNAVVKKN